MINAKSDYLESLPDGFLADLAELICNAYPVALEKAASVDEHIRRNVAGVQKWGHIESTFKMLCDQYDLSSDWLANTALSSYHVELRTGQFITTVSKTDEPTKLPKDAKFRKTLLEATQLRLFDSAAASDGYIYALIVHGTNGDAQRPRFIQVLFPDPDGCIVDKIDVLDHVRQGRHLDLPVETVRDETTPALRKVPFAAGENRQSNDSHS